MSLGRKTRFYPGNFGGADGPCHKKTVDIITRLGDKGCMYSNLRQIRLSGRHQRLLARGVNVLIIVVLILPALAG
jgi:hypothetical protein